CGLRRIKPDKWSAVASSDKVLRRARPVFVAFDYKASRKKRHRGATFADAVTASTAAFGVLLIVIQSEQTRALSGMKRPQKRHIPAALANMFPELAGRLPLPRKPWQAEPERLGIFMALAAAVAAWEEFRVNR